MICPQNHLQSRKEYVIIFILLMDCIQFDEFGLQAVWQICYAKSFSVRYGEYRTLFLSVFIISCFRLNGNQFLFFHFDSLLQYPVNIFVEGYAFGLCRLSDFFVQARL